MAERYLLPDYAPEAVAEDQRNGIVTPERAREIYGAAV